MYHSSEIFFHFDLPPVFLSQYFQLKMLVWGRFYKMSSDVDSVPADMSWQHFGNSFYKVFFIFEF